MNRRLSSTSVFVVVAGAFLLSGCPMPATWSSPRTIPSGTIAHTVGVETFGILGKDEVDVNDDGDTDDFCEGSGCVLPLAFPAYLIRFGVADNFDIGIKGSTGGVLAADFKLQLLRGPALDLAIDPGIQLSIVNYISLPVLVGFNVSEAFQVFLGPKIVYAFITGGDSATTAGGVILSGTLGLRIGISDSFSIVPQFDLMRGLAADASGMVFTAGLGFTFGSQPDYSTEPASALPPPA